MENEAPPNSPLSRFTLAGRMLLLAHMVLFVGGTALYICDVIPHLPTGRYPILVFTVPVGLGCFFMFLILAWVFERIGVKIYAR